MIHSGQTHPKNTTVRTIVLAGLLVGSLDIMSAFVDYYIATGKGPEGILKYVASGVFGKVALAGGAGMALWGLLFHYLIAFCFTILFYWLYSRIQFLSFNVILTGFIYGIFIWLIMNLIVVPNSNTPKSAAGFTLSKVTKSALILIFLIGLPLSIIMKTHFARAAKGQSNRLR